MVPDPRHDAEDDVLCDADSVIVLPVGASTGEVIVRASTEGATEIRGLGALPLP